MLLNQCYRFPGFVYQQARLSENRKRLEVLVRPRAGSKAICSACHRSAAASDHLAQRQFEFIPVWGFLVFSSTACAGSTAQPAALWSSKSPGPMASIPSPKPTCSFWHAGRANCPGKKPSNRSTPLGTKVCHAVEYVVDWGLAYRTLDSISAIGVDEVQYAKGQKYLTLVYQIDPPASLACSGSARSEPSKPSRNSSLCSDHNSAAKSNSSARTCGSRISASSASNAPRRSTSSTAFIS